MAEVDTLLVHQGGAGATLGPAGSPGCAGRGALHFVLSSGAELCSQDSCFWSSLESHKQQREDHGKIIHSAKGSEEEEGKKEEEKKKNSVANGTQCKTKRTVSGCSDRLWLLEISARSSASGPCTGAKASRAAREAALEDKRSRPSQALSASAGRRLARTALRRAFYIEPL